MKKFLVLFLVLDFVFVGLILTIASRKSREIASVPATSIDDLSSGQKNKWNLVESLLFQKTTSRVSLDCSKLQLICDTSSLIELRFQAQNRAFSGRAPLISHTYSCEQIKKDQTQTSLTTEISDLRKMQNLKLLDLPSSQLRASDLYSTEEFPQNWRLIEVKISGPFTFVINEFEIAKVLNQNFDFTISTSAE